MKKIYKSLAVVAMAIMANVAFGQNLKVTADGQSVANGDVIEVPYVFEDFSYPEFDLYIYNFKWDPHLEASTVAGESSMTATVTSLDGTTGFQMCWPIQCQFVQADKSVSSSGTISTTPVDLQIHKEIDLEEKGALPTESDCGSIKVKLECGSEVMEFTVKCIVADKNSVGENFADSNAPTLYYTLEGIQVQNPTKGIYVMRKGGKAKLIKK